MLGSRKLLIVLFIVPCVLSLVCIGAFAAPAEDFTPSVDIPVDTEVVEDVVKSPSALAEETFPAQPLLESSYYKYVCDFTQIANTSANGFHNVLQVSVYFKESGSTAFGSFVWGASFDSVDLWRFVASSDRGLVWGSGADDRVSFPTPPVNGSFYIVVFSSDSTQTVGGSSVNGTLVEESLVPDIADSVFDLGDALITFIMSSWVVMIPLAAWLVILCIGAIRKLVKGV